MWLINVAPYPPPRLTPVSPTPFPSLFFWKNLRNSNENLGVSNCTWFSCSIKDCRLASRGKIWGKKTFLGLEAWCTPKLESKYIHLNFLCLTVFGIFCLKQQQRCSGETVSERNKSMLYNLTFLIWGQSRMNDQINVLDSYLPPSFKGPPCSTTVQ